MKSIAASNLRFYAHVTSWIFNPGCLLLSLVTAGAIASQTQIRIWLALFGILAILGLLILLVSWTRGMVIDADLMTPMNLRDRSQILLVFVALILFMLVVSFWMGEPQPLHAVLIATLILGMLVTAITLVWKISLHMVGVGTLVTAAVSIGGVRWLPVLLMVPVVAWARLSLKRHTPLQLLAGTVLGSVVILLIFRFYQIL